MNDTNNSKRCTCPRMINVSKDEIGRNWHPETNCFWVNYNTTYQCTNPDCRRTEIVSTTEMEP